MAREGSSEVVVQSSGNVFADLGLQDAGEKQTRVRLAVAINQIIESRRLRKPQQRDCWASISQRFLL